MKKSKIKLLPTPTSTPADNDLLDFWSEIEKKPKARPKQVAVQTLDETPIYQTPPTTPQTPQTQPTSFVPKSHSFTDYDGLNEFFQSIKPQKSNSIFLNQF